MAGIWAGLVAGEYTELNSPVLAGGQIPLIVGVLVLRRPWLRICLLVTAFFLFGILRSPESPWNPMVFPRDVAAPRSCPVVLHVASPPLLQDCAEDVRVRVMRVMVGYPWLEGKRVLMKGLRSETRPVGSNFTVAGTLRMPQRRRNPYGMDSERTARRQEIVGTVIVRSIKSQSKVTPHSWLADLRKGVENLIGATTDGTRSGMLEALLMGKRSDLSPELRSLMVKAGVYHVLAVSGLHVGIVVVLLTAFLTIFRLPRPLRILTAVVCVVAFVIFTGGRPSAQRAGMLFLLIGLCKFLQWKIDYPNCVCAAGTLLLCALPHLAWDVGFKLSLGAVFGITVLVPQLHGGPKPRAARHRRVLEYVVTGLAASFAAQVFTLPIVLYHFGCISLLGPVANLLVIPVVTLTVAAGIEASLVLVFWTGLATVFMRAASCLAGAIIVSMTWLTGFIDPLIFVGRPPILKMVVYWSCVAYLAFFRARMKRRLKLVFLLALFAFMLIPMRPATEGVLNLTFIYVGDGDACLIEMPAGERILVDAGPSSTEFDAGRVHVLPFLAMRGIKRLDAVVVTHSHSDHYGGLTSLLQTITIRSILVGTTEGEAGYQRLLVGVEHRGIEIERLRRGDYLSFGGVTVEVLHPSQEYARPGIEDPNAQSVVFRLTYGETSFLFTGDVTPEVQQELVREGYDVSCDVLKVPHHGAPDGVDRSFADATGARYAVTSVGSRFSSHPCPETIRLLEAAGMKVLTTLSDGAVTVTSDGKTIGVRSELGGRVKWERNLPVF